MKTSKVDELNVRVHSGGEQLARDAAAAAATVLAEAVARHRQATVIFAAAASQVAFLDALAADPRVNWSAVTCLHMDEYLGITAEHPASFCRFLRERVEQRVRPRVFHYLQGEADQPLRECQRYSALLYARPVDLCCLGIGENGHVAFNDPPVADFDESPAVKLVKLDEACRQQQVGEGAFPALGAVPQFAYTLTVRALCAARHMICVVPERRKAAAVHRALTGPIETACPASFLRRQAHCTLFLDAESASLLPEALRGSAPKPTRAS